MSEKTISYESMWGNYPQRLITLDEKAKCLEKLGKSKKVPAGTIIFSPGDNPDYCYYIKSGTVVGYEVTRNGAERDFNVMLKNSLVCESYMLLNAPIEIYFKASSETELVRIYRDDLTRAMKEDFELNMVVMCSISYKFLSAMDEIRQTCTYNATWRICNMLLIFADQYGEDYDGKIIIRQKISQQLLSNLLGINRITTVRIIKNLKYLGLIEQVNGLYCIRSKDKLREYQDEVDICSPDDFIKS